MARSAADLAGWLNEGYVKAAVLDVLKRAEYPMLMREVSEAIGFPVSCTNRVLLRLVKSGEATRYKLPMLRHAYCFKTKARAKRRDQAALCLFVGGGCGRDTGRHVTLRITAMGG